MITMRGLRPWSLVLIAVLSFGLVAASCQRGGGKDNARISKLEDSIARVSGLTARVDKELETIQTKDQTVDADLGGLKTSVADLRTALDELNKEVDSTAGTSSTLQKKIDDLSKKLSSLESSISLLETRYNDHLRKYHSGAA
ncbi:MAG: hypothetical protein ACRD1T_23020 [Acidimicrobiia bacterium]